MSKAITNNNEDSDNNEPSDRTLEFGETPASIDEVMDALDQRESYREYQQYYRQDRHIINSDEL